eukprot:CAMPEP_0198581200 /NCGR_PEP_ID=MMETSP1462-20131121/123897_1 /TAXON_ID=1333877 /ORGANISM="Brandtodinium nutriculum, Strain RCC3387" /LENGTH=122 /DNA_ID=CAMNT_0044312573 /DNA_START=60 /DNA_END=425 /DNA_ORIENTATION=+
MCERFRGTNSVPDPCKFVWTDSFCNQVGDANQERWPGREKLVKEAKSACEDVAAKNHLLQLACGDVNETWLLDKRIPEWEEFGGREGGMCSRAAQDARVRASLQRSLSHKDSDPCTPIRPKN